MRTLLPPSLLVLALTLLLNLGSGVYDGPGPVDRGDLGGGASVRIFSQGRQLTPEYFDRRAQPQAIIVDGHIRTHVSSEIGLRVATFVVGGGEPRFENFDLGGSDEDVAAFAAHVRRAPRDAVLAMGVYGSIRRGGDRGGAAAKEAVRARVVGEVLAELGARAQPEQHPRTSWAFLCIRREHGWVPLAESFSPSKGVMLAYQIPTDLDRLDRVPAQRQIDLSARSPLMTLYPLGETHLGPFTQARRGYESAYVVNGVQRSGIFASPPYGTRAVGKEPLETRIAHFVRLGAKPSFECQLGMLSYHRPVSQGAEFQVLVQGEVAGRRQIAVDPNEPDAWLPWTVDLSPWANRWVRLELRTVRLGLAPGEVPPWAEPLVWGEPVLVSEKRAEHEQPRLTEWELFLTLLDGNSDGFLVKSEPRARIMSLDLDGDGKVSAQEWPPFAGEVALSLDSDQDGKVSSAEAERFYERLFEP